MKHLILGFLLALFSLVGAEAQINNPTTVTGASPIVVSGNTVGIQAPDRTVTTSTGVTITSTDFGGQVNVDNASAQNVTTPTSMSTGQTFTVVNQGAGVLTIVNGGVAVNGLSFTTINQYGFITCTANSSSSADCAGVQGGSIGGGVEFTDGTNDVMGATKLTVTGGTIGGTSPNATLAISGSGATNAHLASQTLTDPTGTTSSSVVMMGFGATCKITPTNSGAVTFIFSGSLTNDTASSSAAAAIYYGTGTAPTNGTSATGTRIGNATGSYISVSSEYYSYALPEVITGLTPGTAYWFDLGVATGGTGTAKPIFNQCSASES